MIQAIPAHGQAATLPLSALVMRPQIRTRKGFEEEGLRELAESIKVHGLLQPIVVAATAEADKFHLIAGERRVLAATLAGLDEVPAMVRNGTEAELAAMQATENLQRADLHILDIADGIKALELVYPKSKDLARAIGKSAPWVSKHRRLARLTPTVHAMVSEGLADVETITTIDAIARLPASDESMKAIKKAMKAAEEGELTRAMARDLLAAAKGKAEAKTPNAEGADDSKGSEDEEGASVDKRYSLTVNRAELDCIMDGLSTSATESALAAVLLEKLDALTGD